MNLDEQLIIFDELLKSGDHEIIPMIHPDDCADNLPEYITGRQVAKLLRRHSVPFVHFTEDFNETDLVINTAEFMTWLGY